MNKDHASYLIPFFKKMNASFPEDWCVLHSYSTLPYHSESDVDMAFSGANIAVLEALIVEVCSDTGWNVFQKLWYDIEYCCYYVLKHEHENAFLAIDFLIDNHGIGKYGFETSSLTKSTVLVNEIVQIPNPEIAFCYKLTKRIVKKRDLTADLPYLVSQYRKSDALEVDKYLMQQFGQNGKTVISDYLAGNKKLTDKDITNLHLERKKRNFKLRNYFRSWYWRIKRVLYRVKYPSGMIIYVPLVSDDEIKRFTNLLAQKADILFRFVKINPSKSDLVNYKALIGSTLVICPIINFKVSKAIRYGWFSWGMLKTEIPFSKDFDNVTEKVDAYYSEILNLAFSRMARKLRYDGK